jgi:hypothetical protein
VVVAGAVADAGEVELVAAGGDADELVGVVAGAAAELVATDVFVLAALEAV